MLTRNMWNALTGRRKVRQRAAARNKPFKAQYDALTKATGKTADLTAFGAHIKAHAKARKRVWSEWMRLGLARDKLRRAGAKKSVLDHCLRCLQLPLRLWPNLSCKRTARAVRVREAMVAAAAEAGVGSVGDLPPAIVYYGGAKFPATGRGETAVPTQRVVARCMAMHPDTTLTDEYGSSQHVPGTGARLHKVMVKDAAAGGKAKAKFVRGLLWCDPTSNSSSRPGPAAGAPKSGKAPRGFVIGRDKAGAGCIWDAGHAARVGAACPVYLTPAGHRACGEQRTVTLTLPWRSDPAPRSRRARA